MSLQRTQNGITYYKRCSQVSSTKVSKRSDYKRYRETYTGALMISFPFCCTYWSHLFCGPSDQTHDIFPLETDYLVRWLIHQYVLPLKTDHLVRRTTEQV